MKRMAHFAHNFDGVADDDVGGAAFAFRSSGYDLKSVFR